MTQRLRRMLLVGLDHIRPKDPKMSLGVASIVANLLLHEVPHKAMSENVSDPSFTLARVLREAFSDEFNSPAADIVVGAFVWNEVHVQELLSSLRQGGYRGRIGVAGPQVSYAGKGTLENLYPGADYFVRGYAEDAIAALASAPEPTRSRPPSTPSALSSLDHARAMQGVHWAGQPDKNLQCSPDFGVLPSPYLKGVLKPSSFMRWETQRGCPFRCSFCQHKAAGGGVFKHGKTRIMREVGLFCSDPAGRHAEIAVVDPTFNSESLHAVQVLDAFREGGFKGKLELQIRPEKITLPFLDAAARLGKEHVTLEMGIQSAVPKELDVIQRIPGSDPARAQAKVEEKLKLVASYGLPSEISLIYGLPHQTVSSFRGSIEWCRKVLPSARVRGFPLMLLRGTMLEQDKEALGLVEETDVGHLVTDRVQDFIPHVVETPTMSRSQWEEMADVAMLLDRDYDGGD